MQTRCEVRTPQESPVRVFGISGKGKPVSQAAWTVDISRRGARLRGIAGWENPGETIGVRHGTERARYCIVWVGAQGTPRQGHLGLLCLEQGKFIWGVDAAASANLAPGARESLGVAPRPPIALSPQSGGANRRKDARYRVEGGVRVQRVGTPDAQWTTLNDLSAGGCYIETTSPLWPGSRLELVLHVGESQIRARGEVTVCHSMVGMGIRFIEVSPMNRNRISQVLANLSASAAQV